MDEAVSYRRRTGHRAARSLSAILGAASIPAIFGMGWLFSLSASWSDRGSNDGSFAPWHIFGSRSPPLHVSDFVDHRFPVAW